MAPATRVVFVEGPECSGKSTICRQLGMRVANPGKLVVLREVAASVARDFPLGTAATADSEMALLTMNGVLFEKCRRARQEGNRVLSDRGWMSQSIYGRVRKRISGGCGFDVRLFEQQEQVLFRLYRDVIEQAAVIVLSVPARVSLQRLRSRKRGYGLRLHEPGPEWTEAAFDEYSRYFDALEASDIIRCRRVDGIGTREDVFARFLNACASIGFSLKLCNNS